MKLKELICEAGEFQKYRALGQKPWELAGHLAGKAVDKIAGKGKTPSNTKPAMPTPKSKLGNTTEAKTAIDRILKGEQLDSRNIQALKDLRQKL